MMLKVIMASAYWFHAELSIGFFSTSYEVIEGDGFASVEFGILDGGMTSVDVTVQLSFSNLTAVGMSKNIGNIKVGDLI